MLSLDTPMTNYKVTMRNGMTRFLNEEVTLDVNLVDDIPLEPNGKFQPYKCYLEQGEVA